jgi:hypothetical protein
MQDDRNLFAAATLAAAFGMFPTLTPPRLRQRRQPVAPYHQPGVNDVLMDWDLPKGKRAKRRARKHRAMNIHERG